MSALEDRPTLSRKDVAEQLGLTWKTVYRRELDGDLPHYKIGGSVRFKQSDVDAYIESCRREPEPIEPEPARKPRRRHSKTNTTGKRTQ